ncbi:hypothetical protein DFJ73DRAFT_924589 [Zopfochytrium polystomum]|nr:hypothetical protein DFJ73DRAFT_924589 [Zopfochytrium polystomum]
MTPGYFLDRARDMKLSNTTCTSSSTAASGCESCAEPPSPPACLRRLRITANTASAAGLGLFCAVAAVPVHQLVDFVFRIDPDVPSPPLLEWSLLVGERVDALPPLTPEPPDDAGRDGRWVPSRRILHVHSETDKAIPCHFSSAWGLLVPVGDPFLNEDTSSAGVYPWNLFDPTSDRFFPLSARFSPGRAFQFPGTDLLVVFTDWYKASILRWNNVKKDLLPDRGLSKSFCALVQKAFDSNFFPRPSSFRGNPTVGDPSMNLSEADRIWFFQRFVGLLFRHNDSAKQVLLRLNESSSAFELASSKDISNHTYNQFAGWGVGFLSNSSFSTSNPQVGGFARLPQVASEVPMERAGMAFNLYHSTLGATRLALLSQPNASRESDLFLYRLQTTSSNQTETRPIQPELDQVHFVEPFHLGGVCAMRLDDTRLLVSRTDPADPTWVGEVPLCCTGDLVKGRWTSVFIENFSESVPAIVFAEDAWTNEESGITLRKERCFVTCWGGAQETVY